MNKAPAGSTVTFEMPYGKETFKKSKTGFWMSKNTMKTAEELAEESKGSGAQIVKPKEQKSTAPKSIGSAENSHEMGKAPVGSTVKYGGPNGGTYKKDKYGFWRSKNDMKTSKELAEESIGSGVKIMPPKK